MSSTCGSSSSRSTSVKDSGILLTIRHLCDVRGRRGIVEAIWEDILEAFAKAPDIDLAYPTTRLYTNPVEGKPALQPHESAGLMHFATSSRCSA